MATEIECSHFCFNFDSTKSFADRSSLLIRESSKLSLRWYMKKMDAIFLS
ncbi:hypothetical protein Sjap_023197 [Stephania japonica]|uniref:Uncharacterized protein n=1 Tax=Stephania japonica TaxID=461633 RepID=A0AAP0EDA1_9MAGN